MAGSVRTGVLFSEAVEECLRYVEVDRARKPSTLAGYRAIARSQLLPAFGDMPLESITTPMIEAWVASMGRSAATRRLALVLLHGIFRRAMKVWGLPVNPAATAEKPPLLGSGDLKVFSPEEVWALVRAASSEQDAAAFLTAAFTGLRMGELLALHWRDVDFAASAIRVRDSYSAGALTAPKSGKVRSVPMSSDVAAALARLGRRVDWVGEDDLVFAGVAGDYLDGSALRRRYTPICRYLSEDVPRCPRDVPRAVPRSHRCSPNPQYRRAIPASRTSSGVSSIRSAWSVCLLAVGSDGRSRSTRPRGVASPSPSRRRGRWREPAKPAVSIARVARASASHHPFNA